MLTSDDLIDKAMEYADKRLSILRLRLWEKIPLSGSKGIKEATWVIDDIYDWFFDEKYDSDHLFNLGIATGKKSSFDYRSLVVITVKNKIGIDTIKAFEETQNGKLPATFSVKAPDGSRQLYFRSDRLIKSCSEFCPGISISGHDGFVVAPPSILRGYKTPYQEENNYEIADLPSSWVSRLIKRQP